MGNVECFNIDQPLYYQNVSLLVSEEKQPSLLIVHA